MLTQKTSTISLAQLHSAPRTMRIDAHHHFWQPGRYTYPWMKPDLAVLHREYGPEHLQPLLAQHGIDRSVLVQTICSFPETKWFLELAKQHPFIAGAVGWVDLASPGCGQQLDEICSDPKLVGIRHPVHDEADGEWLLQAAVQKGLRELSRRSIPYDLLIRPPHLAASLSIARALPELPLVIDHIAKPRIAEKGWADWAGGIAALAQCPNVWCKLSGMITEASWNSWKPADLKPYLEHVLNSFGPDRVLFGSDWPVCLLAGSYQQVIEALETNLAHLSFSEREKIFGLNADRCYRLKSL